MCHVTDKASVVGIDLTVGAPRATTQTLHSNERPLAQNTGFPSLVSISASPAISIPCLLFRTAGLIRAASQVFEQESS